MNNVLKSERVNEIFVDSLFKVNEDTTNHVKAEGITSVVGFNPERLDGHKAEITLMLDELPDVFKAGHGGGMSFLQACEDRHGNQWTGSHQRMEQLFQLGIAIDKVECLMPRAMWSMLPGGMPYYCIKE